MKKKIIILIAIVVLIGGVVASAFFRSPKNPHDGAVFETVQVRDIKQTVSVTGSVKPASEVELGFERGGRVVYVNASVGEHVKAGMLLASLSSFDLSSDVQKATAAVDSAKAQLDQYIAAVQVQQVKLTELEKGTRQEQINVKEIELASAKLTLAQLYDRTQTDVLMDVFIDAQNAVNNDTDHFFENDQSSNPRLMFVSSLNTDRLPTKRIEIREILNTFSHELSILTTNPNEIDLELKNVRSHLLAIHSYVQELIAAWNNAINWSDGTLVTETEVLTEKNNLATASAAIQTGLELINSRVQAIESQRVIVDRVRQEFVLTKAPATQEQIAGQKAVIQQAFANVTTQKANILQAEATLSNAQSQFAKVSIRAPFAGTITKQDVKVGEIVSGGVGLIGMISNTGYQVEVRVPEADLAHLQVDQIASVSLDAYPDVTFEAIVHSIDPSAILVEGVATYRTVFVFIQTDERLVSGLSADVDIVTAEKIQVLTIPQRAIVSKEGKTFVRLQENETVIDREVHIGIRAEGFVEILDGLNVGDRVLVREANKL